MGVWKVEKNQENMQELWNEEAAILQAGDASPAKEEVVIAEQASPTP